MVTMVMIQKYIQLAQLTEAIHSLKYSWKYTLPGAIHSLKLYTDWKWSENHLFVFGFHDPTSEVIPS